jgi:hypothetical protein
MTCETVLATLELCGRSMSMLFSVIIDLLITTSESRIIGNVRTFPHRLHIIIIIIIIDFASKDNQKQNLSSGKYCMYIYTRSKVKLESVHRLTSIYTRGLVPTCHSALRSAPSSFGRSSSSSRIRRFLFPEVRRVRLPRLDATCMDIILANIKSWSWRLAVQPFSLTVCDRINLLQSRPS